MRKKKKGNAASHLSVSVRASMLEAKKLSGFAPNLHGRTLPARFGKDSKQTITVGRGSRYGWRVTGAAGTGGSLGSSGVRLI